MPALKQSIKNIFIKRQHKLYAEKILEKRMSYAGWIQKQEEKLGIDDIIIPDAKNSLTNELYMEENGRRKKQNEGFDSSYEAPCRELEIIDRDGKKRRRYILISLAKTGGLIENVENAENAEYAKEQGTFFEKICQNEAEAVIFLLSEGELSKIALPLIDRKFAEDEKVLLIYGDEDVKAEGVRKEPWFKPDWSPDTFLSYFYFGSLVAVRMQAFQSALSAHAASNFQASGERNLYDICFQIISAGNELRSYISAGKYWKENSVCHISEVLFHSKEEGYEAVKNLKISGDILLDLEEEECKSRNLRTGFFEGNQSASESIHESMLEPVHESAPFLISIIIPSKDQKDALFTCIHSLLERTEAGDSYEYEIIIIDNGSNDENKQAIQEEADKLNEMLGGSKGFQGIKYHYEPMEFNFSEMCNLGEKKAKGELLLFLNDDMEIFQGDWLKLLADKARLPYVGAVGAKLLYPNLKNPDLKNPNSENDDAGSMDSRNMDSRNPGSGSSNPQIIQHAGITNLRVGPAHKLQFLSDEEVHYYGKNRGVHNVMAVTGACLMVRREVFEKAGGFSEKLAVAFNDVDLCYTIYELGYYNLVRNDVVLYHHESLSRGKDGESEEKQLRLLREKDLLYEKHQNLYGKDPFYHKYLATDMLESEYAPAFRYQVTLDMPWADVSEERALPENIREDNCVVIGMECAMDIYKWKYGVSKEKGKISPKSEDMGYYFQGYSFVIGADNACYKKTLLLQNKENEKILRIPAEERYRPDIKNNLKDQLNVDLTGFVAKVQLESIPKGLYRFGMLAEDQCSRQKLVNWSNWVLKR